MRFISIFLTCCFIILINTKFCQASGKKILDTSGNQILLKGISLGNWLNPQGYMLNLNNINSQRLMDTAFSELLSEKGAQQFWKKFFDSYITADDFKYIKSVGFNVIRLPFSYKRLMDDQGNIKTQAWQYIDFAIKQCNINNIYIILDLHSAPGGQTGANIDDSYGYPFLYESNTYVSMTIKLWTEIAKRYSNQQIILGYELLNQPISTQFNTTHFIPLLEPLYKKITTAIRAVDKNHIIILDGAVWASQFYSAFGKPFDNNLIYTFHKYWVDPTQNNIQEYIDFSNQYNVPIWMGQSGQNTMVWITTFRQLLEANKISWSFWPYKKFEADSCIRVINPPNNWKTIVDYIQGDRSNLVQVAKNRPSFNIINQSFDDFFKKLAFSATIVSSNYLRALGLKV